MHTIYDCLIVGAGITASAAARRLRREGLDVVVVEQSGHIGGRLASRRLGGAFVEHGAQHLSIRDPSFRAALRSLDSPDLLHGWFELDGEIRYCASQGMEGLAAAFFGDTPIFTGQRIEALSSLPDRWRLTADTGSIFEGHSLLLTAALPQSLELIGTLDAPATLLPLQELASISYQRCLALLIELARPSAIPPPGNLLTPTPSIHFAADCAQKGLAQPGGSFGAVVLANPQFSLAHWEDAEEAAAAILLREAEEFLGAPVLRSQLHKWRYSHPERIHPRPFAGFDHPLPAAIAGDAFGGPRIEGAFLSGNAAAEWILTR